MVYWKPYSLKPWKMLQQPKRQMVHKTKPKILMNISMCCVWWTVPWWACFFFLFVFFGEKTHPTPPTLRYISLLCYFICTGNMSRTEKMPFWQEHCPSLSLEEALECVRVWMGLYAHAGWMLTVLNCDTQSDPDTCFFFFCFLSFFLIGPFHLYANNSSRAKSNTHTHKPETLRDQKHARVERRTHKLQWTTQFI